MYGFISPDKLREFQEENISVENCHPEILHLCEGEEDGPKDVTDYLINVNNVTQRLTDNFVE